MPASLFNRSAVGTVLGRGNNIETLSPKTLFYGNRKLSPVRAEHYVNSIEYRECWTLCKTVRSYSLCKTTPVCNTIIFNIMYYIIAVCTAPRLVSFVSRSRIIIETIPDFREAGLLYIKSFLHYYSYSGASNVCSFHSSGGRGSGRCGPSPPWNIDQV